MTLRQLLPIICLWSWCCGPGLLYGAEFSEYGNPFVWVTVGPTGVKAEVVRAPGKLYLGLGYRQELPEGRGMLFLMPRMEPQIFCMRGMKFPIDIIWIAQEKIIGLAKNISPRFTGDLCSPRPVKFVLEVPGGFADRHGLKVGDPVKW
ncbi:MAG: DUF192 domain-containing protein [Thermodesulfobacteriota bacterium]